MMLGLVMIYNLPLLQFSSPPQVVTKHCLVLENKLAERKIKIINKYVRRAK
jgi:hypothetical protein